MPGFNRYMGVTGTADTGADPVHGTDLPLGSFETVRLEDALLPIRQPRDNPSNTMFSITRQDDGEVDARLVTLEKIEER